ncbi:unnamed protein product [Lactuca virosa]|uniref:NLP1-9 GAF domain-containing protein n=1 Tax=Lactuca virosa TaxID=75947 RepID=A0AAU9MS99_9ASTR|nr:unnamed protein product [Lactuca virosa]
MFSLRGHVEKSKEFHEPHDAVLAEIQDVSLKLPLAQTWGPCEAQSRQHVNSISVIKSATYVFDPEILSFFEETSCEQLLLGEGIVGKALGTNQPCFTDINDFRRTDYPISSYYGLNVAMAIRLRSTYMGPTDFILEFFRPAIAKEMKNKKIFEAR